MPRTVGDAFQRAAEAAGIADAVVFHDLRGTAKARLLLDGGREVAVDAALGHELPGMSATYVKLQGQPAELYRGCFPDWKTGPRLVAEKTA